MRRIAAVLSIAGGLVALLALLAGLAYATDYGIEATVSGKQCHGPLSPAENTVTVRTKILGIEVDVGGLPDAQCNLVNEGNFVTYKLRSGRTTLYQSEGGTCIYDSVYGVGGCGR